MSEVTTNPGDGEVLPETEVDDTGAAALDENGIETEAELDENGDPVVQPSEDDVEEIEHDGQKYALPKALKPLLLMQADYTAKTQVLADQRRSTDELREKLNATLTAATEADEAIVDATASVKAIDGQIKQYDTVISGLEKELAGVHWPTLIEQSGGADQANMAYRGREQLLLQYRQVLKEITEQRTTVASDLDAKVKAKNDARTAQTLEQQQATAKQIEDRDAALKAEFPKWSEEFPTIQVFAAEHLGVPADVVAATTDPRLLKGLRYAKLGFEAEQRAHKTQQVAARVQPAIGAAKPVTRITGASTPRTDPNRMSTEDWMAHRNEQIRKSGRR